MNTTDLDYNEDDMPEGGFFKRNWLALTVGVAVLAGGTTAAIALSNKGGAGTRKAESITMVNIAPPPPVVLPPPPPPPPQEEEMLKAEEEKEEAPAEDSGPSTNNVGNGPADAFKLPPGKGKRGPMVLRQQSPISVWTKYANGATSRIADAMRRHNKLKHSNLSVTARVWIDSTGRITRADTQSSGDAATDAALRNEILNGMQLAGPPPEGMKMPVNLKLNARRPG